MKVEVRNLIEKIAGFPPNYVAGIDVTERLPDRVVAITDSWSLFDGPRHTVSLCRHKDDPGGKDATILDATCGCEAIVVCKHMAQLYAVVKGITPAAARKMLKKGD